MINERVQNILKELHEKGNVRTLTVEESEQINKELSDEAEKNNREYNRREHLSYLEASKTTVSTYFC